MSAAGWIMRAVADAIEEVVYAEAQRGLALQPVLLNELRGRTGILLAVTSAATAFLGAVAIERGGLHEWGVLALTAFAVAVTCCLAVLWPSREWKFFQSATKMIASYCDQPRPDNGQPWSVAAVQRDLALHMEAHADKAINEMKGMHSWFAGAGMSLGAEVVCWLIEYGT